MGAGQARPERYRETFKANHVTGHVLPELDEDDLEDLGIESVGHRVLLLGRLADLKAARQIANRTDVLLRWQRFTYSPYHPFNTTRYKLTPSSINIELDNS